MADIKKKSNLIPAMHYVHKKKDGSLVSEGQMNIDKHGNKVTVVKNGKGDIIHQSVVDKNGKLIQNSVVEVIFKWLS